MFHPSCSRAPAAILTAEEFRSEFPAEGGGIEFKQGAPLSAIAETATAFSNSDGGVILLGVSDDGTILGIDLGVKGETKVRDSLSQVRELGPHQIHRLEVAGHPVVAIGVDRRTGGFAQLSGGQVKERQGASNRTLMGAALADFIARRFARTAEAAPTRLLSADIDRGLGLRLARAWQWSEPDDESWPEFLDRLRHGGFLVPEHDGDRLSVAGALYLLPDPARALGKAFVEVFRYRDQGVDYDRREEFRGPLQDQVAAAADFVLSELGFDLALLGVTRHELHRLPRTAVREALANAVAHRSYVAAAASQAVRIEMRPDRVVVRSPGGLPEGVTLSTLARRSVPRNMLAIRTLRFFGIAEDAGRGVDLMNAHMALNLMMPPRFEADESSVTVTLLLGSEATPQERAWLARVLTDGDHGDAGPHSVGDFGPVLSGVQPQDARLLLRTARDGALVNADARNELGVDAAGARAALKRLRDRGLLQQRGSGSGATYVLAPRPASVEGRSGAIARPRDFEAEILELASEGTITNAAVRARTGLDRIAALRILNRLAAQDSLERRGTRRGSHYVLPDPAHQNYDIFIIDVES